MNNDYYQQVLEDVQSDLGAVEQTVSELQGVERYVQRKMDADPDESESKLTYDEYQALLDDVRKDVDEARSKIGELRGVGNFAREKLKAAGVEVAELAAKKPPAPEPAPKKPAPAKEPPAKKEPPAAGKGKVDTMKTVEFGPDGFPMT